MDVHKPKESLGGVPAESLYKDEDDLEEQKAGIISRIFGLVFRISEREEEGYSTKKEEGELDTAYDKVDEIDEKLAP